jgi:hypothetical protein
MKASKFSNLFAAVILLTSQVAFAGCDIYEDPPISEVDCSVEMFRAPTGSEWTWVSFNPGTKGLLAQGNLSAQASVKLNDSAALVGQVLAKSPQTDKNTVRSATDESSWMDIVLERSAGSLRLKLVSYQYVAGVPTQMNSVVSAWLSQGNTQNFHVAYTYNQGVLDVQLASAAGQPAWISLQQSSFGTVVPALKLRRGVQPSDSGVLEASFSVLGGSAQ